MNRLRLYITLFIALILAGSASLLVSQKLQQASPKAPQQMIIAAAKDLEAGNSIGEEDVRLIAWSGADLPKGAFQKASDVVGRAVRYPIYKDEAILDPKLAGVGVGAGLGAVIPSGMRAVSIRVDDVVAVAGFVGPGTHVDVLLTGNPGGDATAQTRTILENVWVLAAGQKFQPDNQGRPEKVNVVTLLCTTQDAAALTLAANEGRIQLVLRNPTDVTRAARATSISRGTLYGETAPSPKKAAAAREPKQETPAREPVQVPPPPAPVPPPVPTVKVIRGVEVSVVEVSAGVNR